MSTIKLKRSAVQGKVPLVGDLDLGEIALNTYDGKAYMKKNDGVEAVVEIGSGGGGGSTATSVYNYVTSENFEGDGNTATFTLSDEPFDKEHVFVTINGVHQTVNTYSVSGTSLILDAAPANADLVEVRTFVGVMTGENPAVPTDFTINNSNSAIVDSFSKAEYRTAKYVVQMSEGGEYHSQEVLLVHNDVDVFITQYAKVTSNNDLGIIDAEVSGANINLLVDPVSANTNVKTVRIHIGT